MSKFSDIKQQYKSSLKSMDTEETLDLMFYRPIGYMWAVLCAKVGITPNAILPVTGSISVAPLLRIHTGRLCPPLLYTTSPVWIFRIA